METDVLVSTKSDKRRPYHYTSNWDTGMGSSATISGGPDQWSERANYSRYLYYNRLRRTLPDPDDGILLIPPHVIPNEFFYPQFMAASDGKQSSLVTIFALWNTMMGTSLLSMPWAMERAGVIPSVLLLSSVAAISFYFAYRILQVFEANENSVITDFAVLCKRLLGRWAQIIAILFSALTLLGACVVYWVLMSNFMYHTVDFIHTALVDRDGAFNNTDPEIFCPADNGTVPTDDDVPTEEDTFHQIWVLHKTVPLFLILVLGPISCIRSPTFFTKFNSFGTLSVVYLLVFVVVKWAKYGFNINLTDTSSPSYAPLYKETFPALSGMLSLAFFIHNCVLTIMKNNRVQRNNKRDLGVAFIFVALTYFLIGGVFYIVFPLEKTCIQDNFLNNFRSFDLWSMIARIFLFFQMTTVYPLLVYILRVQICYAITKKEPTLLQTIVANIIVISVCVCFAIWLPKIGTIIRFSGALCGLVYIFLLPISLYLKWQKTLGTLSFVSTFTHLILLGLGVANFVLQFFVHP